MPRKYFTTPIYYVNGKPHIGHAHTSVMGDILKRSRLMQGDAVFFSTGTDEHGQKNQEAIEKSGLDAETYLSRQSRRFRDLFDRLNVNYDYYIRTTDKKHKDVVTQILQMLFDKGLITKKDYSGLYCVGCEQFKKLSDLDDQGRCPDHLTVPVQQTEVNYFFTLSRYQDWLIDQLKTRTDWIKPEVYRNEVLAMLNEPLDDLCISRPKRRISLGIELPFDTDYVAYVWFDALINYISNIGYSTSPDFDEWWAGSTHLMAKDIIKTHIIYWPIMLKAIGIAPPNKYRIHGYWVGAGGQKMSKSLGNIVDPNEMIDLVGADGLRYYLTKFMGGTDAQISRDMIVSCYNTDLANNIGNLHSRVVKFIKKRTGNKIPDPAAVSEADAAMQHKICSIAQKALHSLDLTTTPELISDILEIADILNVHFNDAAPWKLVKDSDEKDALDSVLYTMVDSLRIMFELLWIVIPEKAEHALASISAKPPELKPEKHVFTIGKTPRNVELKGIPDLFPRIEA